MHLQNNSSVEEPYSLANDILRGAKQIAYFLGLEDRQALYNRMNAGMKIPHWREGAMICARKSRLLQWIEDQENNNSGGSQGGPSQ